MKRGISGYVCVRNAVELDYCIRECVESMLPVVDEIVVSDGESTDGTQDMIRQMAARHPQIRTVVYPWNNPHRDLHWWVNWLNAARRECVFDMSLTLDADEVLDPCSYETIFSYASIGASGMFRRMNYWKDPHHMVPFNKCVGEMVARLAPTHLWMCSDEPIPLHEPNARTTAKHNENLVIHHLGFLRNSEAFVKKNLSRSKRLFWFS